MEALLYPSILAVLTLLPFRRTVVYHGALFSLHVRYRGRKRAFTEARDTKHRSYMHPCYYNWVSLSSKVLADLQDVQWKCISVAAAPPGEMTLPSPVIVL